MQGVSKTDFENYVKANDAILRNMQNQGQGLQNQMTNLTKMLSKFVNSNTASTSSSGSLPSNTVTNLKEDLKGITTRSGVVYQGPTITTSSPKVVERRTEVTKDTIFPTNNGITEDVQPPVVPIENPVSEPVNAPRHRENANEQKEKFYKIFKDMSFKISFMDALNLMPKFASTLKALIGNKEKLSEMARTPLSEHCSAVILNKLPEKLGDPGRFLIPSDDPTSPEVDESYYEPKGEHSYSRKHSLNSDPSHSEPRKFNLPEIRKERKLCENPKLTNLSKLMNLSRSNLRTYQPHLEICIFLEGQQQVASHNAKDLSVDERPLSNKF
ncbi:hypothetical protein Tco_0276904 [Tanacetum coccineum]